MLKIKVGFGRGGTPLYFNFTNKGDLISGAAKFNNTITVNKHSDWSRGQAYQYIIEHHFDAINNAAGMNVVK